MSCIGEFLVAKMSMYMVIRCILDYPKTIGLTKCHNYSAQLSLLNDVYVWSSYSSN